MRSKLILAIAMCVGTCAISNYCMADEANSATMNLYACSGGRNKAKLHASSAETAVATYEAGIIAFEGAQILAYGYSDELKRDKTGFYYLPSNVVCVKTASAADTVK